MRSLTIATLVLVAASPGLAELVEVRVAVRNLSPADSLSFAPFRMGFGNGTFDSFNNGEVATAPIISIAEGGSGADWFPAFMTAEPNATLGTVVSDPPGPLLPGQTAFADFTVDTAINRFFTFGSMVVPSNDYFIGNDSPTQYEVFDTDGNLLINAISQFGRDIWDAGSELDGPFGAAFLEGYSNDDHIDENGVVHFDFEGLDVFNGLTTAAGYVFNRQIGADDEVYRVTLEIIPAPGAAACLGLGFLAGTRRRR